MGTYVALLRGINVGGKHMLPMKELAALFAAAGCTNVVTYIQSGNVVFATPARNATGLPDAIGTAIFERRGFETPVLLRSAEELRAAIAANPFVAANVDPRELHLMFLAAKPAASAVAALDANRSAPDEFAVHGREIYLRLPNGTARSKLTNAHFDAKLATKSSIRNWRTVLELASLAGVGAKKR